MNKIPLDMYDNFPNGMLKYLRNYGWHFNKKAYDYACGFIYTRSKTTPSHLERITPFTKEEVDALLKENNLVLDAMNGYDHIYIATMAKSDYMGNSIADNAHLAKFIKDTIDDPDAGDGEPMRCWYAKMVARGIMVDWDEIT